MWGAITGSVISIALDPFYIFTLNLEGRWRGTCYIAEQYLLLCFI